MEEDLRWYREVGHLSWGPRLERIAVKLDGDVMMREGREKERKTERELRFSGPREIRTLGPLWLGVSTHLQTHLRAVLVFPFFSLTHTFRTDNQASDLSQWPVVHIAVPDQI